MNVQLECCALATRDAERSDVGLWEAARGSGTEKGLTLRQETFVRAVVAGKSQSEAYRTAYPSSQKWKPPHVWSAASELAGKPKVRRRVADLRRLAADSAVLDAAAILEAALRLAFSDIRNLMHDDGRVRVPSELDDATAAAVQSFEIDEYGRVRYKMWDKNAAIDQLCRHLGLS